MPYRMHPLLKREKKNMITVLRPKSKTAASIPFLCTQDRRRQNSCNNSKAVVHQHLSLHLIRIQRKLSFENKLPRLG